MELALTYITLGAYAFFCLDVVIKTILRLTNNDLYSDWQRRIFICWGLIMLYTFSQLTFDFYVNVQGLTWDTPLGEAFRLSSLLIICSGGMMLLSLSTHRKIDHRMCLMHIIPFIVITFIVWSVDYITQTFIADIFLYILYAIYAGVMLRIVTRNIKEYQHRLVQTYSDLHRRSLKWTRNLIWQFCIVFLTYIYFCFIEYSLDYIYYPIATSMVYYINFKLITMRETKLMEEDYDNEEQAEENAEEKSAETPHEAVEMRAFEPQSPTVAKETDDDSLITEETHKQTLREQTKQRLEDSLEEICISRQMYLNPELTVNDLAIQLNSNRTYISQYFSEHNTTFLKFINDLRAEHAMYLIKSTNNKLSTIMTESGFRHSETFRRAFQSRYNCDPKDVVRNRRKID